MSADRTEASLLPGVVVVACLRQLSDPLRCGLPLFFSIKTSHSIVYFIKFILKRRPVFPISDIISPNNKRSSHIKKCKWLIPHCHPVTVQVPVRQRACVLGNLTAALPASLSARTQCEYYKGHTSSTQRMSADAAGV